MQVCLYLGISISPLIIKYLIEKVYYNTAKCFHVKSYNCSTFFTTYKNQNCRSHIFEEIKCDQKCSYVYLSRITNCIENATQSISLCVCLLTLSKIITSLIAAKKRGVHVRLISDNQMIEVKAAKKNLLLISGINIKTQPNEWTNSLMHHKFCLVDEFDHTNAQLFYGSLNLTLQGLASNWEMVVFTKDQTLIQHFSKEFEYLWNKFSNVVMISNE